MLARGVSKSGHLPDGPDFGEARPAWGAVPECNTGNPPTTGKGTRTNAPSLRLMEYAKVPNPEEGPRPGGSVALMPTSRQVSRAPAGSLGEGP